MFRDIHKIFLIVLLISLLLTSVSSCNQTQPTASTPEINRPPELVKPATAEPTKEYAKPPELGRSPTSDPILDQQDEDESEPTPVEVQDVSAGLIFHNGVVLTMTENSPASAIAVRGQTILAVGGDSDVLEYAGPYTEMVDLLGRTLLPGFVDPHSHALNMVWRDNYAAGQEYLLSLGITTTAELFANEALLQDLTALDRAGELHMRISLYPVFSNACGEIQGSWYYPAYKPYVEPGAKLHIPGVKLYNDGGTCNAPAVSFEYGGGFGHGDLYYQPQELAEMILAIQDQGYQVAVHALGDRAVTACLDAFEIVLDGRSNTFRHRIEHNAIIRDETLSRYSEVQPVATLLGHFPGCASLDTTENIFSTPMEYKDWDGRWKDLVETNPDVHFAWHSDNPALGDPDPMLHLQGFLTRRQLLDDGTLCEPAAWAADDLLPIEKVLPMMTREAAYALRRDDIGTLAEGKMADLVILSENPLETDPYQIQDIQVLMTMVDGNVEYCRPGNEVLCP